MTEFDTSPTPITEVTDFALSKMYELGIEPLYAKDKSLVADGNIHRYDIVGQKRGSKNGAYLIYADGIPTVFIQDWSNPDCKHVFSMRKTSSKVSSFSHVEIQEFKAEQEKRKIEQAKKEKKAADLARITFENAQRGLFEHKYLQKKKLATPHGVRLRNDGRLIIPLFDITGKIISCQYIDSDGKKRFQPDGKVKGAFYPFDLDKLSPERPVVMVGEGFATMASLYEVSGASCVATMSSGNIEPVVEAIIAHNPGCKIMLMSDNDLATYEKRGFNPGLETAEKVFSKFSSNVIGVWTPPFEESSDGSDWNDYISRYGENAVVKKIIRDYEFFSLDEKGQQEYLARERIKAMSRNLNTSVQLPSLDFVAGMFPRGYISAIVGAPGTGKTMFIQKIVSDLSLGGEILGGVVKNEPARKSIIFAAEAGFDTLVRRASSLRWSMNPTKIIVVDQYTATMNGISVMLNEAEGLENVKRFIEVNNVDIVFFDTFMSFHDVDENRSSEIKPLLVALMELAKQFNVAVVLVHHTRKRTVKERMFEINQDDSVGSGVFNRLVSLIIGLEQSQEESNVNNVKILKTWFKRFPQFRYQITERENGGGVFESYVSEEETEIKPVRPRKVFWQYILERFPIGSKFVFEDIDLSEIALSVPSVRKQLAGLVQCGKLIKEGSTRASVYTVVSD